MPRNQNINTLLIIIVHFFPVGRHRESENTRKYLHRKLFISRRIVKIAPRDYRIPFLFTCVLKIHSMAIYTQLCNIFDQRLFLWPVSRPAFPLKASPRTHASS